MVLTSEEGSTTEEAFVISKILLVNRGVKDGSELYTIKNTKAKAMLIEVCFCDNREDMVLYHQVGVSVMADAIVGGLLDNLVTSINTSYEKKEMSLEEFIVFVGEIAKKGWQERRIMLPSVVIAQAIKESARGTSELARNANALFGIKKMDGREKCM